jgi:hypothetical protein
VKFKYPGMAAELSRAHPELRSLLLEFDAWSQREGLPEPVLTELLRSQKNQTAYYVKHWGELVTKLQDGKWLSSRDRALAVEMSLKSVEDMERAASERFTWQYVLCAADLRTHHYSTRELVMAKSFFRERATLPRWSFLEHDITANHLHVERRDMEWRQLFRPDPPLHDA